MFTRLNREQWLESFLQTTIKCVSLLGSMNSLSYHTTCASETGEGKRFTFNGL